MKDQKKGMKKKYTGCSLKVFMFSKILDSDRLCMYCSRNLFSVRLIYGGYPPAISWIFRSYFPFSPFRY